MDSETRMQQRWDLYQFVIRDAPLVENGVSQDDDDSHEVLVLCQCKKQYRLFLRGDAPIPSVDDAKASCPHCNRGVQEWLMLSGHSAGIFNASLGHV